MLVFRVATHIYSLLTFSVSYRRIFVSHEEALGGQYLVIWLPLGVLRSSKCVCLAVSGTGVSHSRLFCGIL